MNHHSHWHCRNRFSVLSGDVVDAVVGDHPDVVGIRDIQRPAFIGYILVRAGSPVEQVLQKLLLRFSSSLFFPLSYQFESVFLPSGSSF